MGIFRYFLFLFFSVSGFSVVSSMIAANALFPPLQTRSRFEGTRSEVYELMKRIREAPQEYRQTSPISCEGYLYVQEKRK